MNSSAPVTGRVAMERMAALVTARPGLSWSQVACAVGKRSYSLQRWSRGAVALGHLTVTRGAYQRAPHALRWRAVRQGHALMETHAEWLRQVP